MEGIRELPVYRPIRERAGGGRNNGSARQGRREEEQCSHLGKLVRAA